jgi:thymidylate synthase ThyX
MTGSGGGVRDGGPRLGTDETFTAEERKALAPYFTNPDGPVFALVNLPEVVKGALFARYSRSNKSLRRLFLDEFLDSEELGFGGPAVGLERAEKLYDRVFSEYGDDSVAQLGGAHVAVEGASNILTKVIERGRLMAYLEQSTRYVPYTDKIGGRWKYCVPPELAGSPLAGRYGEAMDGAFETYARWIPALQEFYEKRHPKGDGEPPGAYTRAIRARALDTLRGLLPAATRSNVGTYGSGQAYEALILRLRTHPLGEARECAERMLAELRKVIPSFLKRLDQPHRGGAWEDYLRGTREGFEEAVRLPSSPPASGRPSAVALTEYDPEGEVKVVAAALYEVSDLSDDLLMERARAMSAGERFAILSAYAGERKNRRHRPGRAFERTSYRFDVMTDYGAFRDLQRHRMLSMEWQRLTPGHGYAIPDDVVEAGAAVDWRAAMDRSAELYRDLCANGLSAIASYAVAMAYRIRFYMHMNAREAMHVLELRTTPQGHPSYRIICQEMHRLIAGRAGHEALAKAMRFVDHSSGESGRMDAETALEARSAGAAVDEPRTVP